MQGKARLKFFSFILYIFIFGSLLIFLFVFFQKTRKTLLQSTASPERGEQALLYAVICYIVEDLNIQKKLWTITPKKGISNFPRNRVLYNRFTVEGLGVTQPSQIRYIHYFYKLLKDYRISPTVKLIDYIKLSDIPAFSHKNSCKPIFEIISAKDYEKVLYQLIYS